MIKNLPRVALTLCLAISTAFAATSRSSWVVSDIYNYNHPYAATDSTDLATKMSTMNSSEFLFFRGTDDIFYHDMTTLSASSYVDSNTAYTWLGGDTHIANFGGLEDSSGKAVFAVNDFDEGYLGQFVWDVRRTAASIVLAGRENGISDSNITTAINTFVSAYLAEMKTFSGGSGEKTFQLTTSNTAGQVKTTISDSSGDSRSDLLSKYTTTSNGKRIFQTSSTLATVNSTTYNAISAAVTAYVQTIPSGKQYATSFYTVKDIRQKFGSGTGSLGKLRYYVLVEGPSTSTSDDVILELKQESTSNVAIADAGQMPTADYSNNEGQRVARTNRAQSINADVLTGYATINGVPYYVHEKSPYAEDFDYTQLTSSSKFNSAMTYIGQALASAHALADQDYDSTVVPFSIDTEITNAVTSTSGFQTEISTFAFNYVAQVDLDYQSFQAAYKAGTPLY